MTDTAEADRRAERAAQYRATLAHLDAKTAEIKAQRESDARIAQAIGENIAKLIIFGALFWIIITIGNGISGMADGLDMMAGALR